jgi:RNA polymerase sigma factor (sigma-70 family)
MHSPSTATRATAPTALAPFADIADLDAIGEVARGNREMFEVIVRRYNPQLYRIGMAYLRNHALAEDAMQSAYVKAFFNLGKFQQGAAFSTWLTRIMINESLMVLRRHRHSPIEQRLQADAAPEETAAAEPAAAEQISLKEMKILLEQAIAQSLTI